MTNSIKNHGTWIKSIALAFRLHPRGTMCHENVLSSCKSNRVICMDGKCIDSADRKGHVMVSPMTDLDVQICAAPGAIIGI